MPTHACTWTLPADTIDTCTHTHTHTHTTGLSLSACKPTPTQILNCFHTDTGVHWWGVTPIHNVVLSSDSNKSRTLLKQTSRQQPWPPATDHQSIWYACLLCINWGGVCSGAAVQSSIEVYPLLSCTIRALEGFHQCLHLVWRWLEGVNRRVKGRWLAISSCYYILCNIMQRCRLMQVWNFIYGVYFKSWGSCFYVAILCSNEACGLHMSSGNQAVPQELLMSIRERGHHVLPWLQF